MRVTVLGSGTSVGVPTVGCECETCRSNDPKDKRLRPSIMVENDGYTIIVDTSSDFRQQALRLGLRRVDAVLITHCHADHVFGLDDIRPFNFRQGPIPFFANEIAWKGLRQVFGYVFDPKTQRGGALPQLVPHTVMGAFCLFGLDITPIEILHGRLQVLAYRFGNFAYATDCNFIPDESCEKLAGLDTLIIDGLRYNTHSTHMSIEQSLEYIERLKPKRAFLTHMNHDILHARTSKELPEGVELAYDGLQFEV
ncbi:MAG TPA: MBL fold metallo-hydrolase [Blastocatellia bacterium]|nr:MBL fold metallo-hydrolase [Blastocatellia bacterium]